MSENTTTLQIPKVIHYCWFGRGEKSDLMKRCINSWHQHCPDWEIIEWNEDNFDVNFCPYASNAYIKKKYAFCADAARLKIIYEHGGVYFDTDAELRHPIDELMNEKAWFGYATATEIGTGVGFGAVAGHPFIKKLLDHYTSFDISHPFELCTVVDTKVFHREYPEFAGDHTVRQYLDDVLILNNIWHWAIHHYTNTWQSPFQKFMNPFIRLLNKWGLRK